MYDYTTYNSSMIRGMMNTHKDNNDLHDTYVRLCYAAETLKKVKGQSAIGRLLNVSPHTIFHWKTRGVSKEGMIAAEKYIGCSVVWIETGKGNMIYDPLEIPTHDKIAGGYVPLISWEQAIEWKDTLRDINNNKPEDWLLSPTKHSKNSYYLKIRGIAMYNPAGDRSFNQGDLVLIDADKEITNKCFIVVHLPGQKEAILRQLIIDGDKRYIQALNPSWPEKIAEIPNDARICGVAVFQTITL